MKKAGIIYRLWKDKEISYQQTSEPHITADDLIELGLNPSPLFKIILDKAWNMHLKGVKKEHVLKQMVNMLTEDDKAALLSTLNGHNQYFKFIHKKQEISPAFYV